MQKIMVYITILAITVANSQKERNREINFNFQQNDYVIKFERAEKGRINPLYVKQFDVITFKYNRTWPVVNITYEYNIDLGNDLQVVCQVYKFASNEYRLFPIRVQMSFCEAITKDVMGFGAVRKCGNFSGCPHEKNRKYHYCNFAPNQHRFPPFVPSGQYMLEFQGVLGALEIFVIKGYGTISRPIPYDRK